MSELHVGLLSINTVTLALLVFVVWQNRKLRKEIKRRRAEFEKEMQAHLEQQKEVEERVETSVANLEEVAPKMRDLLAQKEEDETDGSSSN